MAFRSRICAKTWIEDGSVSTQKIKHYFFRPIKLLTKQSQTKKTTEHEHSGARQNKPTETHANVRTAFSAPPQPEASLRLHPI